MMRRKLSLAILAAFLASAVLFATQIVTDDFNRANAVDLGANWTNLNTTNERLRVDSNGADMATGAGEGLAYYSGSGWTGGEDQYAEAKALTLQANRDMAAACRVSGTTISNANAYLFVINGDDAATVFGSMNVTLYKQVSGAFTEITAGGTTKTVSANDVIRCEAQGSTIRGMINGVQALSTTDSSVPSGGKPGLYIGSGTGCKWDDWAAGDFGGAAAAPKRLLTLGVGVQQ